MNYKGVSEEFNIIMIIIIMIIIIMMIIIMIITIVVIIVIINMLYEVFSRDDNRLNNFGCLANRLLIG